MQDVAEKLMTRYRKFGYFRKTIAKILLEYAQDGTPGRGRLAQRDIAVLAGTDWETVHASLMYLQQEKALRIEGHRIIINKELLSKEAGLARRDVTRQQANEFPGQRNPGI
jgi:hypothetical protein